MEMQSNEGCPWLQNLGEGWLMPRPLGRDRVGDGEAPDLFPVSPDHKSLALIACHPKEKFADVREDLSGRETTTYFAGHCSRPSSELPTAALFAHTYIVSEA